MDLSAAQEQVDGWISQFEEGYWPPLANLARLTEEVGELARELNDRYGSKPKKADESEGAVEEELGDILFVLICLANALEHDLSKSLTKTLAKYRSRDSDRWTKKEAD